MPKGGDFTNLFEIFGTIGLKDGGFNSGISNAMGKAESFGKKFGDVVAGVGKAAAVGLGVAATTFGALSIKALQMGGDLEQSLGGIETLFKDNADIVIANAEKAYLTAGVNANDYMQQVTSFSASLLQSLGGDTESAARVADMAIIDMADNANKMGSTVENIQNAYQGFAKQNYTMLDNLKLGYGGTKTEMERLLQDAQKLSGVKYDISNLDDVYEAIHVIQTELDITGTTAKEGMETLSGSLATAKAALDNFLSGASDAEPLVESVTNAANVIVERISGLLPRLTTGLSEVIQGLIPLLPPLLNQMLPAIIEGATGLINRLVSAMPALLGALESALPSIITAIGTIFPQLVQAGFDIIMSLGNGITVNLPTIIPLAKEAIMSIVEGIAENLPDILKSGIEIIAQLAAGIAEMLPELVPTAINAILSFVETLIDNVDLLIDGAIALVMGLTEGIINALPILLERAPEIITKLVMAIVEAVPKLLEASDKIIEALIIGIWNALPELLSLPQVIISKLARALGIDFIADIFEAGANIIKGFWQGITGQDTWFFGKIIEWINKLVEFFKTLPGKLKDIFDEVIQGIKDWVDNAVETVKEIVPNIINNIAKFFEELPAKAIEWGKGMIDGFVQGIKDKASAASDAVKGVIGNVSDFIGFHSPAKKGEGRHIVEWGFNMISGFTDGVSAAIPMLTNMLNNAISDFSGDIGVNATFGANNQMGGNLSGTSAVPIASTPPVVQHISLNVKIDKVDEVYKLIRVFSDFSQNQVVYGGVR